MHVEIETPCLVEQILIERDRDLARLPSAEERALDNDPVEMIAVALQRRATAGVPLHHESGHDRVGNRSSDMLRGRHGRAPLCAGTEGRAGGPTAAPRRDARRDGERLHHRRLEHTNREGTAQQRDAGPQYHENGAQDSAATAGRIVEDGAYGHLENIGQTAVRLYCRGRRSPRVHCSGAGRPDDRQHDIEGRGAGADSYAAGGGVTGHPAVSAGRLCEEHQWHNARVLRGQSPRGSFHTD